MPCRIIFIASWLIVMLVSACVPMPRYQAMENERKQTEKKTKNLEIELQQAEQRLQWMGVELSESEAMKNKYAKDLKDLQIQYDYLKKINRQLSQNTKKLQQDLKKKKSVIHLQEKVIRLLDDTKKTIETSLKDQIAAQQIEVVEEEDKLKVIFVDKILFDSGSFEINPKGKELLLIMTASLKDNKDQDIVVEGHTDNVPLSPALIKRFPSNWELSTARAAAVVRFFQEHGGIRPERLSARGYSFYKPVASNETEDGRHQNRRIEIILSPSK